MTQLNCRKILVVEDEADQQAMLRIGLERAGYVVCVAESGQQALAQAELQVPDLILLDLMLAGHMDGFEVLARLKASDVTDTIPVIICSAWGDMIRTGRA